VIRFLDEVFHTVTGGTVSNVVDHVRAYSAINGTVEPPAWLKRGPVPARECAPMRSGIFHLPSRKVLPHTSDFFATTSLDFDSDPNAGPPLKWLAFLDQLWNDCPDCVELLQTWFGYLLSADTSQQKILLLVGPKRSGKGTIARVLHRLIGLANVAGPTLASLASNFGLWGLLGKSLAIISDARLSGRSDQSIVVERLLRISGQDCVDIDRKFQTPLCCRLPARLMLLSNEVPRLNDASGALASRFLVLPVRRSFYGAEDRMLTDTLFGELPGILNWSIAGWDLLQARGKFTQPTVGQEMIDQLGDLASPVSAFVRERCIVHPGQRSSVRELYEAWRLWCSAAGRDPGTDATFSRDLSAAVNGIVRRRPRDGEGRGTIVDGIGLVQVEQGVF
jgi:putative DNA primase/helicase